MDIKGFIEWIGHDAGSATATIFPYLVAGVVAFFLLYLVVGYLRVSQMGLGNESHAGSAPVMALPAPAENTTGFPRGVPYCPTDRLLFPAGATVCPRSEDDLLVDCANCGTTIKAADESCFHCGTRDTLQRVTDED